jgi:hypothetical protein
VYKKIKKVMSDLLKILLAILLTGLLFVGIIGLIIGNFYVLSWHWSLRVLLAILIVVNIVNLKK